MPQFSYTAIDADGEDVQGQLEARDSATAFSTLQSRGLHPLTVQKKREGGRVARFRPVRRKDEAIMIRQLAVLVSAGVKLGDAMNSLAKSAAHPELAERASRVRARLRSGERFSESLQEEFPQLPAYVPQMAELGETTGQLGPALIEAADQFDYEQKIASDVRSALAYPSFLVFSGTAIVSLMFLFVVPRFAELLSQSEASIPPLSRAIIGFSLWFSENWLLAIGIVIAVIVLSVLAVRQMQGGMAAIGERLWMIKKYQSVSILARWCRTLGGALTHGANILPAMELAEKGVSAPRLKAGLSKARQSVRAGDSLDQAIVRNVQDFDAVALDMIRTGRASGKLPEMLLFAASIYSRETEERTKKLMALVEPLAIVTISLIVGTIVISIVLAMTSLYEISP
ncbi:type II secretion system F family protein [Hyphomonas sp. FCG-A18]|uniref:type II secretion system F family protein n=1 Tax=Hyphomonas sp. FCG-A18 TaxID=3080019 RepID=UPI002B2F7175|nr:type II secretion system F family protein [Hyphomonas sp. FCG-A18]